MKAKTKEDRFIAAENKSKGPSMNEKLQKK